jgi:hypothetical protein
MTPGLLFALVNLLLTSALYCKDDSLGQQPYFTHKRLGVMGHACNPSYSGGRGRRILLALGKKWETYLRNNQNGKK